MTFEERHKALMEYQAENIMKIDAAHLIGFIISACELQSDLLKEVKRLRELLKDIAASTSANADYIKERIKEEVIE